MIRYAIIGLLCVLSLSACAPSESPLVRPSEPHGIVRGDVGKTAAGIYPVRIVNINGQEIPSRPGPLWVAPGEHEFIVIGVVDPKNSFGTSMTIDPDLDQRITVKVEAGKTYYLGAEAVRDDPRRWRPTVWKTE